MDPIELKQRLIKKSIAFQRAKEKAWIHLQQDQAAVLSIFEKGESVPLSIQQRIQENIDKYIKEWSEDGLHFRKLLQLQKKDREKYLGKMNKSL